MGVKVTILSCGHPRFRRPSSVRTLIPVIFSHSDAHADFPYAVIMRLRRPFLATASACLQPQLVKPRRFIANLTALPRRSNVAPQSHFHSHKPGREPWPEQLTPEKTTPVISVTRVTCDRPRPGYSAAYAWALPLPRAWSVRGATPPPVFMS